MKDQVKCDKLASVECAGDTEQKLSTKNDWRLAALSLLVEKNIRNDQINHAKIDAPIKLSSAKPVPSEAQPGEAKAKVDSDEVMVDAAKPTDSKSPDKALENKDTTLLDEQKRLNFKEKD